MIWHPDIPEEYRNQIVTGDARELAKAISDESIDLIFTDPIYDRIDDYHWLAETATRILKPNRACLTFCGIEWLGETIQAMRQGGLEYRWQLILSMPYRNGGHIQGGFSQYISCLWFEKGHSIPIRQIPDMRLWRPADGPFKWAKNPDFVAYYLENFSLTLDVAFEIDPVTAERARERVRNTKPPLFVLQEEQLVLGIDG